MVIGLDACESEHCDQAPARSVRMHPLGLTGTAMAKVTSESAFEDSIEAHLRANDWLEGDPSGYDRGLGLDPSELVACLKASQPDEWEQLTQRLRGAASAKERVAKYVADQLTQRGTVDVLRGVTRMNGVSFRLAFFAPANGLTGELWQRYDANRLSVVRQLHHGKSNTADSIDVMLFVNGIPTATAELKTPLTQQSVRHAIRQYQRDRNPSDLVFRARTVVHFAADTSQVYTTTRLQWEQTRFLPFNQGSGGAGEKGGRRRSSQPRRLRHGVPLGAGVAARRAARPARRERPCRGRLRPRQAEDGGDEDALPALSPVGRGAETSPCDEAGRPGNEPIGPAFGWVGQVEHLRVGGASPVPAAHPVVARRFDRRCQGGRSGCRPADCQKGHRHHRPCRARPAVAVHGRRLRARAGHDREDRQGLRPAACRACLQYRAHRHHDSAEVSRGRRTGATPNIKKGSIFEGRAGRQPAPGHANRCRVYQKQNQVSSADRARNSAVSASWIFQKRLTGWETIRCR